MKSAPFRDRLQMTAKGIKRTAPASRRLPVDDDASFRSDPAERVNDALQL
ncbi:MAG: hypothetical protein JO139_05595 [Alphaproteobacteria bacterium]|nr:hypothetical protein [Alphaproteobacteria bacterium]